MLEALSAIVQAYSIVLIQSSLSIKQYSYKTFMSQRMMEVDEWMIFKIQSQKKPEKLKTWLTKEMYESFELSFLQDHNMIVEEFSFY